MTVKIFDTTLRDGEQSPGVSLNSEEKLRIARQLAKLKVDVIEAGFPVSSQGDFQAVEKIAREVEGPTIAALARTNFEDIDPGLGGNQTLQQSQDSYLYRHLANSYGV